MGETNITPERWGEQSSIPSIMQQDRTTIRTRRIPHIPTTTNTDHKKWPLGTITEMEQTTMEGEKTMNLEPSCKLIVASFVVLLGYAALQWGITFFLDYRDFKEWRNKQ